MKKLSSIFLLSLIFLLFSSCERPDLTDDVEMAYEIAASSCKTIDGNMWSPKASSYMTWHDAVSYCDNLTECGYTDWRLPNIDELRTLIQNHSGTQTGGSCPISEKAGKLAYRDWTDDCDGRNGSNFSKLGDTDWFWSSSTLSDYTGYAWYVNFHYGDVGSNGKSSNDYVRCVR
ncbi:DUF1566 domain-containing protein [bacterium]|nr:DUF1566 domain-containing protein [bacterium]